MGKQGKMKKKQRELNNTQQNKSMDPVLIKAYVHGREIGIKEGRIEGIAEIMTKFHVWVEEVDGEVKGIGPYTKQLLRDYFAKKIEESIHKNKQ